MKLKTSRYNVELDLCDSNLLLFNTANASFLRIDGNTYNLYLGVKNGLIKDSELIDESMQDDFQQLYKGGIIVNNGLNEIERIRFRFNEGQHSKSSMSFTILPTLDCNFACPYCFEDKSNPEYMDEKIMDAIKAFFDARVKLYKPKHFHTCWFGGEPLLNIPTIDELSTHFIKTCGEKKINYTSKIITNGWLLSDKVCRKLKNSNISSMQITLDGSRESHNSRRILKNGQGTFDRIIDNILLASEYFSIAVRMNFYKSDINRMEEILECVGKLKGAKKVGLYPAMITSDNTKACADVESKCMSPIDYADLTVEFYTKLNEMSLPGGWFPKPYCVSCGATRNVSCVIQPNGDLCRCWNQVGIEEESYSNIVREKEITNPDNFYKWVNYSPFENDECYKCKFLPLCTGGCPARWFEPGSEKMRGSEHIDKCTTSKYNIEQMLLLTYNNMKKSGDKTTETSK